MGRAKWKQANRTTNLSMAGYPRFFFELCAAWLDGWLLNNRPTVQPPIHAEG
jgi:hypothetical protein